MLLARYKKLGGSLVAGGLTWRTDEGRSKFLVGMRGDLSATFHGKGTTFSRADMRLRCCGFQPLRQFTLLLYHEREGDDS